MEVLGDRLLFIDGDTMALQLADEHLQAEREILHRFTILELEVGVLLLQKQGRHLLCAVRTNAHRRNSLPRLLS